MTRIDIFSGFLGAGKTTLIKKLIAEAYQGEKLVLIENEFGEIAVDGGFLKDAGIEIREMSSGCICCSLVGDFAEALEKVKAEYSPDRVLIEPSGVGKLSDVIRAVQDLGDAELVPGSFTTVDLCVCRGDEAAFYKFGAAPSYLKKGGVVRRVTGVSLPVGLRGAPAAPDITRATLEPGSFVVLISDGVADPGRDDWLQDLLAGWQGEDPQALATCILSESVRRERLQDDCAVEVLYRPAEGAQKI